MKKIEVKNLSKCFHLKDKEVMALNNISLDIENGSFTTIVGRSGCGKTTLLRILCGLEKKTKGDVVYIKNKDFKEPKISIVFQEPRLMPWLTVKENIKFSIKKEENKKFSEEKIQNYLEILDLKEFQNAYPSQISGGMAQRVSLGRTLCYEPDIILMDEPLGALDAYNRKILQKELIKIFNIYKKTIIFVTHDIDEAIYLGEKIIVMENGKIINQKEINTSYPRDMNSEYFLEIKKNIFNSIMNKI